MLQFDASDERYNDVFIEEVGDHTSNCANCVQSYLETRQCEPPPNEGSDKEAKIFTWQKLWRNIKRPARLTLLFLQNKTSIQWSPGSQIYLNSKEIIFGQK